MINSLEYNITFYFVKILEVVLSKLFEPPHVKTNNLHRQKKGSDQLRSYCEADHTYVFAVRIVQFLYFLIPKFPASNHLLCLYNPVCVGPGRNPNC